MVDPIRKNGVLERVWRAEGTKM